MSDRYARQMVLPEVGPQGQARLAAATVLVAGAGGLACPVLQYLCAAGVGRLFIVDHDRVDESNLQRQPLYRMSDLGAPKACAAAAAMRQLNPEVTVEDAVERLTPANAAEWVSRADVIVDAADSLALTYILSDECLRQRKPLISASVLGLSGYVGAFCGGGPSYRAVFPEMPRQAGSCAQSGVLGTAVGVMGTLQAHMVLAILLELTPTALGQLVSVDFRTLRFSGFSFASAHEPPAPALRFIAPEEVSDADLVVDLRSLTEAPVSPFPGALRVSVEEVERAGLPDASASRVVLCCRSGIRAWRAAQALRQAGRANLALIAFGD
ncbi:MAG TPA: HesA/MoeB/ThiF family protein [Steroidobacteraceae bacterium]|jgi:molybdopterin/thiamine biosynthesis adenylyltransferase|nr:HesA/MoeB/ThiF family protein [Steroidobacteraceae bacterium]